MQWRPSSRYLIWILVFELLYTANGYYRYTVKQPLLALPVGVDDDVTLSHDLRQLPGDQLTCSVLGLDRRQVRLCRHQTGSGSVLVDAKVTATRECRELFTRERWNCSMTHAQHNRLMSQGLRETGFVHAITSAALVHTVARACSSGVIDGCTCAVTSNEATTREPWRWGGCGDNIEYAAKFTRKFLRSKDAARDLKGRVDHHNSKAGIKVSKNHVTRTCKCHGVSGSCSVKTCWNQLPSFHVTGSTLKRKYDSAVEVVMATNQAISESHLTRKHVKPRDHHMRPGKRDIVYIDSSPSFCRKGKLSSGTRERECSPETDCDVLCCGRGYNTRQMYIDKPCYCKVIWCCDVRCQTCTELTDVYTCK